MQVFFSRKTPGRIYSIINKTIIMVTLHFDTRIDAPAEKVWKVLWDDASYRSWTSAFSEGSHAESDWKEGSQIKFLDGKGQGMYSKIDRLVPNKQMSFKHLGELKDGVEQPESIWAGSMENYYLKSSGDSTELSVDVDITEDFQDYFKEAFPKALENVKRLAEN